MKTPFAQRSRALLITTRQAASRHAVRHAARRVGITSRASPAKRAPWWFRGAGTTLITDGRFTEQARRETSGVRIVQQSPCSAGAVGEFLKSVAGGGKVGFRAVARYRRVSLRAMRRAGGPRVRWVARRRHVEALARPQGRRRNWPRCAAQPSLADKVLARCPEAAEAWRSRTGSRRRDRIPDAPARRLRSGLRNHRRVRRALRLSARARYR